MFALVSASSWLLSGSRLAVGHGDISTSAKVQFFTVGSKSEQGRKHVGGKTD